MRFPSPRCWRIGGRPFYLHKSYHRITQKTQSTQRFRPRSRSDFVMRIVSFSIKRRRSLRRKPKTDTKRPVIWQAKQPVSDPADPQNQILPSPLWNKTDLLKTSPQHFPQSTTAKRASCSPALPCPTLARTVDGAHQDTGHRAKSRSRARSKSARRAITPL